MDRFLQPVMLLIRKNCIQEIRYIRDWNYTCSGKMYYGVIYKGRLMYVNKKYINEKNLVAVNQPKSAVEKKENRTST